MRLSSHPMRIRPRRSWRVARRSGAVWPPMALRWRLRRRRNASPMAPTMQLRAIGVHSWSAQVHLHFNLVGRRRVHPARPIHPAAPTGLTHLVRIGGLHTTHLSRTVIERRRERLLVRSPRERDILVRERKTRAFLSFSTARPAEGAPPVISRPLRRSAARLSMALGSARGRGLDPLPIARSVPRRSRGIQPIALELHVSRPAGRTTSRPIPRGSTHSVAMAIVRPAELVWRTPADEPFTETGRSLTIASAAAPASGITASAAPAGAIPAAAARPPRPDPAWVDRLAEDVIGRVERRVRIERERRGV